MQFTNPPIVGVQRLPRLAFCLRSLAMTCTSAAMRVLPASSANFRTPSIDVLLQERSFGLVPCTQHDALVESSNLGCENESQLSPGLSSRRLWPGS